MELTLRMQEIYFLGKRLNGDHLNYSYIAAMPEISQRRAVIEQECEEALEKCGAVEENLLGELTVRPEAAAFVERRAHGRPLLTVRYQPPGAEWRRVTVDARCVMRVHSVRSGDLLAESEPGKPRVLRAGFVVLAADDLSPRYT